MRYLAAMLFTLLLAACSSPTTSPRPNPSGGALIDTGEAPERLRVVEGEPVRCERPWERDDTWFDTVLFEDPPLEVLRLTSSGFVAADLTGDDQIDFFLPGEEQTLFFTQSGGRWIEEAEARIGDVDLEGSTGASAADYDGDGDLDLIVFRSGLTAKLLRNDRGVFVDVSDAAGIATGASQIMGAAWADFDLDGDLDLAMGGYRGDDLSWLYANDGDGTFTDVSDMLPAEIHAGWAFMSAWFDVDGDLYPELIIPNDFGSVYPSVMLQNEGGASFRIASEVGYHYPHDGMGIVPIDLNGDDYPDWIESTFRAITALESVPGPQPMGVFYVGTERARGMYVDPPGTGRRFGWGVDAGDVDNDGDTDIVATFGTWDKHKDRWPEPDILWLQGNDRNFTQWSSRDWDSDATRGGMLVDVNADGWLDIPKRTLDAPSRILMARCGARAWTKIRLEQSGANRHAIGAVIDVYVGEMRHRRWLSAGSVSMFSGGPPEVHVGLGDIERITRVEVRWPDGRQTVHSDLPTRRLLTVIRPD